MSPPRKRLNCVAASSSRRCSSSSSVSSGKEASQREIKSWLVIRGTCRPRFTHRVWGRPRQDAIELREGPEKRPRSGPRIWEQAATAAIKMPLRVGKVPGGKRPGGGVTLVFSRCLTPDAAKPLITLVSRPDGRSAMFAYQGRRGKSGLHGSTVPDNLRRGRPQGQCHRKQTALPSLGDEARVRVKGCGKSAPRSW